LKDHASSHCIPFGRFILQAELAVKEHLRQTEDKPNMLSNTQHELHNGIQTRFEKFTEAQKGFEEATMKRLNNL
jgi:hypothetical protein